MAHDRRLILRHHCSSIDSASLLDMAVSIGPLHPFGVGYGEHRALQRARCVWFGRIQPVQYVKSSNHPERSQRDSAADTHSSSFWPDMRRIRKRICLCRRRLHQQPQRRRSRNVRVLSIQHRSEFLCRSRNQLRLSLARTRYFRRVHRLQHHRSSHRCSLLILH